MFYLALVTVPMAQTHRTPYMTITCILNGKELCYNIENLIMNDSE